MALSQRSHCKSNIDLTATAADVERSRKASSAAFALSVKQSGPSIGTARVCYCLPAATAQQHERLKQLLDLHMDCNS